MLGLFKDAPENKSWEKERQQLFNQALQQGIENPMVYAEDILELTKKQYAINYKAAQQSNNVFLRKIYLGSLN